MNNKYLIELKVSAPGKVILFGEHSVVYGKQAIAASIDKITQATFKEQNEGNNIYINFPDIKLETVINLTAIKIDNKTGKTYITPESINHMELNEIVKKDIENYSLDEFQKCAMLSLFYLLRGIFSNTSIKIPPFKILITSQLTIGAGTGSSASFAICLAGSLFLYFKAKLYNIPKSQLCISDEDKEIINKWAYSCERLVHGTPSGLDNFVCTYGSVVSVTYDPETKGRKMNILNNAGKLRILLVNSGKPRRTANMLKNVSELKERQEEIVESLLSIMDDVARDASNIISCIGNLQISGASEMDITTNVKKLQDLIDINHGLLVALSVSHPDLNNIIAITSRYGLHSKLTGAGGGGYAYTLIPPDVSQSSLQECINDLSKNGYEAQDVILAVQGILLN